MKYLIRVYYRGMQGLWIRNSTLRARDEDHARERLGNLVLGAGWKAQVVVIQPGKRTNVISSVNGPQGPKHRI